MAIVDCSDMFRLLQSKHHQDVYSILKKDIISIYMSGTQPDDGYIGMAETCNCSVQLLHSSCALTSHILLLCVLETQR